MPGRHDFQPPSGRRRWAPTALDAVVAATPATSLFAALGLAGGGYLVGREGLAACGAMVGAFGLIIERFQTRGVRVRLRRERARYRSDVHGVSEQLRQLQRELSGLRDDMKEVRSERDAVRAELHATLRQMSDLRTSALGARPVVAAEPVAAVAADGRAESIGLPELIGLPEVPELIELPELIERPDPTEPVDQDELLLPVQQVETSEADLRRLTAATRAAFGAVVPGQSRSPIATGGIPMLRPGPSESLPQVIDLRSYGRSSGEPVTEPTRTLSPEAVDALVYAALAEADADELTRTLEVPGEREAGRHAGPLHTGDAHHAGNYARGELPPTTAGPPTLFVVKR
ncbi:MAG TPA: hypothetical protein VHN80_09240, partial [Kineosporiaceae bacterium]|nr:hypothetical protein [Kineosporiaceae bacterium]